MNVEIRTEAKQFLFWEICFIFSVLYLVYCSLKVVLEKGHCHKVVHLELRVNFNKIENGPNGIHRGFK
jgi:hypothetical protein